MIGQVPKLPPVFYTPQVLGVSVGVNSTVAKAEPVAVPRRRDGDRFHRGALCFRTMSTFEPDISEGEDSTISSNHGVTETRGRNVGVHDGRSELNASQGPVERRLPEPEHTAIFADLEVTIPRRVSQQGDERRIDDHSTGLRSLWDRKGHTQAHPSAKFVAWAGCSLQVTVAVDGSSSLDTTSALLYNVVNSLTTSVCYVVTIDLVCAEEAYCEEVIVTIVGPVRSCSNTPSTALENRAVVAR